MRVLVTGSEGSLMQGTVRHLLENGHEVVGVDNHARYDDYDRSSLVDRGAYAFREADLTDFGRTMDLFRGVDGVVDAAATIYGVRGFHEHPATILSNDLTVHRNVLEAAVERDVDRVAYVSSSMVYEQDDPPHHEDDVESNPVPSTDYGLSKLVGERLSRAFQAEHGLEYTIWRPFNVITPHERAEDEPGLSHVFADFIHKILIEEQNPMEIFGDGEQVRCFTWIHDVAEAIATQSFAEETRNEAYNLANPEPVTMTDLARRIFAVGRERGIVEGEELAFEHVPIYEDDVDERIPAVEKAVDQFGWDPEMRLDDSLQVCIDNALEDRVPDSAGDD